MNRLFSNPLRKPSLSDGNGKPQAERHGTLASLEKRAVRRLMQWVGNPPVTIVLYGSEEISPPGGSSKLRVLIRDRATLWKLALDPDFEFGEAYMEGNVDVEGDLVGLISLAFRSLSQQKPLVSTRLFNLVHWPYSNSLSRSRKNVTHHYDIGNDFYQLWLDERMVYTCAYFADREQSLEDAQVGKLDHVCRKLRLRPGQQVLEAGCGWGALALHMARHYGVTVKAYNISHDQIAYAREQAREQGLEDRVEFIEADWRRMWQPCDVFVSVGMLEHVGVDNYSQLGDVIHRCLKPDGLALIHSIGRNRPEQLNTWIERRIFPGAVIPSLGQMMDVLEPHSFSVLDVENLRLHYALTLRHWLDRFEQAADSVRQMFDEEFVRMWRFYLSGAIAGFETGCLQLFQVLFARGVNNEIPWTRDYVYSAAEKSTISEARNPKQARSPKC